jgi:hypothetical protein
MSRDISTSTSIHPHSTAMSFELNHMPQFGDTTFKIKFHGYITAVDIFLPMTPQELIALLEEQVANLKSISENDDITETNTDSDESTELKTFADKFNASPIGLVVNNILNK